MYKLDCGNFTPDHCLMGENLRMVLFSFNKLLVGISLPYLSILQLPILSRALLSENRMELRNVWGHGRGSHPNRAVLWAEQT